MKFRNIIPEKLRHYYRKHFSTRSRRKLDFILDSPKETFINIYNSNHWKGNESISGRGSTVSQTETVVEIINLILNESKIRTILDLPCGDFNWMKRANLKNVTYIGADIVDDLILDNSKSYSEENKISFKVIDLINDNLPACDIIINRDCLVHLSYSDIYQSLQNIKSSGSKYLLTTTFTDHDLNFDIITGDWRKLNLLEKPFNFPVPQRIYNENCTEGNGRNRDKSLALWKIDEIILPAMKYQES